MVEYAAERITPPWCGDRREGPLSGRDGEFAVMRTEVHLVGRAVVEGLMQTPAVVKIEVRSQLCTCVASIPIGMQVDVLVFHAAPEPLHKHVVYPSSLAVHA